MDHKGDLEFNSITFEKKLSSLKDSQESINSCCQWCLANRQYHKKIVSSWLNVLKRVKIEQRLVLFYLANDVIQYAKRRNYEFVESWGTTLQKATTMVRDEKIKHKILRIFKIWEQRAVYGEEFISDLCGLISASPTGKKSDEPHEFQSSYLIQKVKLCAQLEVDTDVKLRELKEHNPKIQLDGDSLIASLKDRAHVDDVEKELDDYNKQMENYINALKLEIKARIHLISLLTQAETALDNDKKDVKTVTSAYKAFGARVKMLKKKLDEKIPTLSSPPPSPDINAPSPSPDSDIELPSGDNTTPTSSTDSLPAPAFLPQTIKSSMLNLLGPADIFNDAAALYTNAGYYNPVPPPSQVPVPDPNVNFNKNFSTFIGSDMPFNIQNIRTTNMFQDSQKGQDSSANESSQTQTTNTYNINDAISSLFPSMAFPPPPPASSSLPNTTSNFQFANSGHIPLQPPPMPPFNKTNDGYNGSRFSEMFNGSTGNGAGQFNPSSTNYQVPPLPVSAPYDPSNTSSSDYQHTESSTSYQPPLPDPFPANEEYNPEEELETWAPEPTWDDLPPVEMDTPESPPMYEKAGYGDPIEYREGIVVGNVEDVDHRVLPGDDIISRPGDVDHRNLISLTDSPHNQDQDYRNMDSPTTTVRNNIDQDYRSSFNIENFKLPPPPPPPPKMPPGEMMNDVNAFNTYLQLPMPNQFNNYLDSQNLNMNAMPTTSPKPFGFPEQNKMSDNMDLCEDDSEIYMPEGSNQSVNPTMKLSRNSSPDDCFQLPPPFPDLLDDVDANQFLDNVTEDFEEFDTEDLDGLDQLPAPSNLGIFGDCPTGFPTPFSNPPNPNIFTREMMPPMMPWITMQIDSIPNNQFDFQNFQVQSVMNPPNFNRGTSRGRSNWGNNRGFNTEFRGHGRRGSRGGSSFRGNRGSDNRGSWNKRGRGGRGHSDRGRQDFRGTF